VFIEFKDLAYSVIEDTAFYNVTVVKQGEPGQDITVQISPSDQIPSSAIGKRMTMQLKYLLLYFLYIEYSWR